MCGRRCGRARPGGRPIPDSSTAVRAGPPGYTVSWRRGAGALDCRASLTSSAVTRRESRRVSMPFGARLQQAVETHGPLCVGLDPHPSLLDAWDLPDDAVGL